VKISLDWISDFVDLSGIAPETIADRLTLCTAEVEGFEKLQRVVEGVMIGEVPPWSRSRGTSVWPQSTAGSVGMSPSAGHRTSAWG
jgi:hypothetical protein